MSVPRYISNILNEYELPIVLEESVESLTEDNGKLKYGAVLTNCKTYEDFINFVNHIESKDHIVERVFIGCEEGIYALSVRNTFYKGLKIIEDVILREKLRGSSWSEEIMKSVFDKTFSITSYLDTISGVEVEEEVVEKTEDDLSKEILVEELIEHEKLHSIEDGYVKDEDEDEDDENVGVPVNFETSLPSNEGKYDDKRVILVADRFVKEDTIITVANSMYETDIYTGANIVNFWAMSDVNDELYLLRAILELRKSASESKPEKIIECYNNFVKICQEWFTAVKQLQPTDIVCRRIVDSDRIHVSEIIMWLWGYFYGGKGINWLPCEGSGLVHLNADIMGLDKGVLQSLRFDCNSLLRNGDADRYLVNHTERFIQVGILNALIEENEGSSFNNPESKWMCDTSSLESQIAGAFGSYIRKPYQSNIPELMDYINGKYLGGRDRLEAYELFLQRYFEKKDI